MKNMQQPGALLRQVIEFAEPELLQIPSEQTFQSPQPGKWSPAEIIGHLIDSASNNHGRFLRAQQTDELIGLPYDQEFWVSQQQYRIADWHELVQLWAAFNRQIARIMDNTPDDVLLRKRNKHNLDRIAFKTIPATEPVTLHYFMMDYVAHLEHHLRQIRPEYLSKVLDY